MKRCCKCRVVKHEDAFGPNRSRVDGLQSACKLCRTADHRAAYLRKRYPKTLQPPPRKKKVVVLEPLEPELQKECDDFLEAVAFVRGCDACGVNAPYATAFYRKRLSPRGSIVAHQLRSVTVAKSRVDSHVSLCDNCKEGMESGNVSKFPIFRKR